MFSKKKSKNVFECNECCVTISRGERERIYILYLKIIYTRLGYDITSLRLVAHTCYKAYK